MGPGISGGLCNCIPQYSVGCSCLSVLGMPASGDKVLVYHVYINIYSCISIIVWECTLMCMRMVTLLSMRFCVFICVYMYSFMYLLNCIFIDCLYYWSLLTIYYCFLWICSANFGIKQLELELELESMDKREIINRQSWQRNRFFSPIRLIGCLFGGIESQGMFLYLCPL